MMHPPQHTKNAIYFYFIDPLFGSSAARRTESHFVDFAKTMIPAKGGAATDNNRT
jgi:hypothetical protein